MRFNLAPRQIGRNTEEEMNDTLRHSRILGTTGAAVQRNACASPGFGTPHAFEPDDAGALEAGLETGTHSLLTEASRAARLVSRFSFGRLPSNLGKSAPLKSSASSAENRLRRGRHESGNWGGRLPRRWGKLADNSRTTNA